MPDPFTHITGFNGINNRIEPTALGMEWQVEATGVLSDDGKYLINQPSIESFQLGIKDIFGTKDSRLFTITSADELTEVDSSGNLIRTVTGVTGAPFQWEEIGTALFLMSTTGKWIVYPDRVVPWAIPEANLPTVTQTEGTLNPGRYLVAAVLEASDGRIGGCNHLEPFFLSAQGGLQISVAPTTGYITRIYVSDVDGTTPYYVGDNPSIGETVIADPVGMYSLGPQVPFLGLYSPPTGILLGRRGPQLAIADWEPDLDRSVIYFSQPDYPHLFDLFNDFWMVPGKITLLATIPQGLVIGTDRQIFINTADNSLQKVADYGALPGTVSYDDFGMVWFWTERGLCSAPPFANLTDDRFIPENRTDTTGSILMWKGSAYYLCAQHGPLRSRRGPWPNVPLTISSTRAHGVSL